MKRFFKNDKAADIEIASVDELPENALVWAGLLKKG